MKYAKINPLAKDPTRKNPKDAGADLYACMEHPKAKMLIPIGGIGIIHTGIAVEIPESCDGAIEEKSRTDYIILGGIVDEEYQGELLVKIANVSGYPLEISHHEPIAQLIFNYIHIPEEMREVPYNKLFSGTSSRGKDGGIARQAGIFVDPGYDDEEDEEDADELYFDDFDDDYMEPDEDFIYDEGIKGRKIS